jgi:hypothetical protein
MPTRFPKNWNPINADLSAKQLVAKLAEKQKLQKRGLMQKLLAGEWRTGDKGEAGLARTEGNG